MPAEEAERLAQAYRHGTSAFGFAPERSALQQKFLHERGLRLTAIREELARTSQEKAQPQRQREISSGDLPLILTQAAMDGSHLRSRR